MTPIIELIKIVFGFLKTRDYEMETVKPDLINQRFKNSTNHEKVNSMVDSTYTTFNFLSLETM